MRRWVASRPQPPDTPDDGRLTLSVSSYSLNVHDIEVDRVVPYTTERLIEMCKLVDSLATDVIHAVGPAGNFLAEEHTVRHFRREIWFPGGAWTRETWDGWEGDGRTSMGDRATAEVKRILATHQPEPMDAALVRKVDRIVEAARRELG